MGNARFEDRIEYDFKQILTLIESRKIREAKEILKKQNEVDIAEFLESLAMDKLAAVFRMLPKEEAAEVFAHLDIEQKEHIINSITDAEITEIIEELFLDDTVDLMEELPSNVVKKVMQNVKKEKRDQINQYLKYPEHSAGAIMTAEFIDLKRDVSVSDAIERVRKLGADMETIYTLFVVSADRKLEGIVSLKQLIMAENSTFVSQIMDTNIISCKTQDDQEDVAALFAKYDLLNMPVVDSEGRLVGICTVDDVIDVMQQETTEDFAKMAAITPINKPYDKTGVWEIVKARSPWLLVLMVSATFTHMIIESFESALEVVPVLYAAIPMLMDTAGNAGTQSSTTIVRAMSLNEVRLRDIFSIMWKEIRVAVYCGIILAVSNFGRMIFFTNASMQVAFVVSATLVLTVFIAKAVGSALPLLAERVRLDPAVMSATVVTTIADVLALIVYFNIAQMLLDI